MKYARKFSFFMWLLYVQLLGDRTDTGLCEPLWSIRLNCQWLSSKRSTFGKHRCATVLAQKTKRET